LPAYLPVYKYSAHHAREVVWLTAAEARVGQKLWGDLPGRVVSMAIDTQLREARWTPAPYILYSGRVDPNKGCRQLFDYFLRYKQMRPSSLRLVITGKDDIPVPVREDIEFRGFVTPEEKFQLMAGAKLFVNPSPNESFSIVTLEAMAQGAPALVSSVSSVLADHIKDSGAGRVFSDFESFAHALDQICSNDETRARLGQLGRDYVLSRYQPETIRKSLISAIEQNPRL
jgi:glycosyltransferase involved in cell wall biosynthesis